jgi:acetyl-CoA decarbonylase/synthase complex subunit gamma
MELSGLQIFKLLPGTNCAKCGVKTCLAFAMKIASKRADISECPDISEEAKKKIQQSLSPPQAKIIIKAKEKSLQIGEESILFRHEKTFLRQTGLGIVIDDLNENHLIKKKIEKSHLQFERAGQTLSLDLIGVKSSSLEVTRFLQVISLVRKYSPLPLVLISEEPRIIAPALQLLKGEKPLLYSATEKNWERFAEIALKENLPLVVSSKGDLNELKKLVENIQKKGIKDIVLEPNTDKFSDLLKYMTLLRRQVIKRKQGLLYPTVAYIEGKGLLQGVKVGLGICKYASLILVDDLEDWQIPAIFTLRQAIFTDPRRPLQVESKIYPIGTPTPSSPFLCTTNFSLTYFIVSSEIEASQIPAYLLVIETEGLSVLTAFSAGKFNAEIIKEAVLKHKAEDILSHKYLIIPGYVAIISGELEEKLKGWRVLVGPQEAALLPSYLKEVWPSYST